VTQTRFRHLHVENPDHRIAFCNAFNAHRNATSEIAAKKTETLCRWQRKQELQITQQVGLGIVPRFLANWIIPGSKQVFSSSLQSFSLISSLRELSPRQGYRH
jgi:hypothetical protein